MKTAEIEPKKLLTVEDLATQFSVSERTIWSWAASGKLPKPFRIGRVTRWLSKEVDDLIATKTEER